MQEDEFGSDIDDDDELDRLAAMPVDEFIREIPGGGQWRAGGASPLEESREGRRI